MSTFLMVETTAPGTPSTNQVIMYAKSDGKMYTKDDAGNEYLCSFGGTMTVDITMSGTSIIEAEGADVASAATTDIWTTDGNTRHITGTTTITSFGTAPQAGAWMKVIFDGALTLTHGANLSLPGSANITTAADDFAFVYADTTTQFDVLYFKKNGTPIVAATGSEGITVVGSDVRMNTNNSGGVGAYALMMLDGSSPADGATVAGTALNFAKGLVSSNLWNGPLSSPSGTWRNVSGLTLGDGDYGLFIRTA